MLLHTIAPYQSRKMTKKEQLSRFEGEIGGEKHKEFIHSRCVKECKFVAGEQVVFERNKFQLIHIYDEFGPQVQWDGLRPLICEIWDGHKNLYVVYPKDLRKA